MSRPSFKESSSSQNDASYRGMRLHVFLAHAGLASRRHAEEWVQAGRVQVNGQVVTQLGTVIDPQQDQVAIDGRLVEKEPLVYVLCNKPKGVICTNQDPQGRPTLLSLLRFENQSTQGTTAGSGKPPKRESPPVSKKPWIHHEVPSGQGPVLPMVRLFPIGRLDYATEGAILLTNDGALSHRLMHPSFEVIKVYHAKMEGHLTHLQIQQLRQGVVLPAREGAPRRRREERTAPASILPLAKTDKNTWLELVIHEGKNRQIHRMAQAVGSQVRKLARLAYAGLAVTEMPVGSYRLLERHEIQTLYDLVGLSLDPEKLYKRGGVENPKKTGSGRR